MFQDKPFHLSNGLGATFLVPRTPPSIPHMKLNNDITWPSFQNILPFYDKAVNVSMASEATNCLCKSPHRRKSIDGFSQSSPIY